MRVSDRTPILIATIALAAGFLGSLAMIAWLASTQTPVPDSLSDMPLYTGGALAALLPGALGKQTVEVDQPDDSPVPVVGTPDP